MRKSSSRKIVKKKTISKRKSHLKKLRRKSKPEKLLSSKVKQMKKKLASIIKCMVIQLKAGSAPTVMLI